jgi:hypothetical protein
MITIVQWISNVALLCFWLAIGAVSAFFLVVFVLIIVDYLAQRCTK